MPPHDIRSAQAPPTLKHRALRPNPPLTRILLNWPAVPAQKVGRDSTCSTHTTGHKKRVGGGLQRLVGYCEATQYNQCSFVTCFCLLLEGFGEEKSSFVSQNGMSATMAMCCPRGAHCRHMH